MKIIVCSLILAAIGCGGSAAGPAASPRPDPAQEPTVALPPDLLCTPHTFRAVSVPGVSVQIVSSSTFAAISLGADLTGQAAEAAAGPGCPGGDPLRTLFDCQRNLPCGPAASIDALRGLGKRMQAGKFDVGALGKQRVEVAVDHQGALILLDGQEDVPQALADLFPAAGLPGAPGGGGGTRPRIATPTSGAIGGIQLPCGARWEDGPCGPPPTEPQCTPTPPTDPRVMFHTFPLEPAQPPGCAPCAEICRLPPPSRDNCFCAQRCTCNAPS
jgi:hypothetical protein